MKALFTTKHFNFLAQTIGELHTVSHMHLSDVAEIAGYFASCLESTNPLFKRDKFLEACGVEETTNGSSNSIGSDKESGSV